MDQLIGHFRIAPGLCSKARRDGRSLIWKWSFIPVADPGEGSGGPNPPLIFRPNGGPNGRNFLFLGGRAKFCFWDRPPPYLRVWMTAPPPYLKVWIRHCIFMQIKLIFLWKVLQKVLWECLEFGNGQLCVEKGGKFEWFINIVPRTFHEKMGGAREPWGRECFRRTWEVQMVKEST